MERRSEKRVRWLGEAIVEGLAGGLAHDSRIADLSVGGAFVEAVTVASPGETVRLTFQIGTTPIQVNGEVRYAEPRIGMGVRFVDLAADSRKAIETIVAQS